MAFRQKIINALLVLGEMKVVKLSEKSLSKRPLSEIIPWLIPLADGSIIVTKDSSLMATFEITGIDTDSAQISDINWLNENVQRAAMGFNGYPITLWWTVKRVKTEDWPGLPMPDEISQLIDNERKEAFLNGENYINRHFVTVMSTPQIGMEKFQERVNDFISNGESMLKAFFYASMSMLSKKYAFAYSGKELDQAVEKFDDLLNTFADRLGKISPRRLAGKEYYAFLNGMASPLNGFQSEHLQMPKGYAFLDQMVGQSTIDVHGKMLKIEGKESGYLAAYSVKGWPDFTCPDMGMTGLTDSLLSLSCEVTISQIFRVSPREKTIKYLKGIRQFNELLSYPLLQYIFSAFNGGQMNPDRGNKVRMIAAESAGDAISMTESGNSLYGWYNYTVTVASGTPEHTEELAHYVSKIFTHYEMTAVREKLHLLSAFAGTLPGNAHEVARWAFMRSENMADLAPVRGVQKGEKSNRYLTEQTGKYCPAVTVMNTSRNTPYHFNFHVGDLAHTFVVGPAGAGKSSFVNFLISQWRKYGSRVIIFDKDRSCRIATIMQGGKYIDMSPGSKSISINPFRLASDHDHHEFLAKWAEGLISSRGYKMTAKDALAVMDAITGVAADPEPNNHRLLSFFTLLPAHLQEQLSSWIGDQPLARYFDNIEDNLDLADFTGIEMGALMDNNPMAAAAFMEYVFYRIFMVLNNQPSPVPTLIYIEECWFFMSNPNFEQKIRDWLKTFRKKVAHVVMATQSVDDLAQSTVFSAIRDNMPTRIFLPNPNATSENLAELYRRQFELTDEQIHLIRNATPKREYFITQPGVAKMVDCRFSPVIMACIRSDSAAMAAFNRHYNDGSPQSEDWKINYIKEMANG